MPHQKDNTGNQQKYYTDWYNIWMQQSKVFFDSANENLKNFFNQEKPFDPSAHMRQIENWLSELKKQWQMATWNMDMTSYSDYLTMMNKMMNDATDLMLKIWVKKTNAHEPINNVHDLYALWLNCCHDTYQKYMHSQDFQKAYGDFMNTLFKLWKANLPG